MKWLYYKAAFSRTRIVEVKVLQIKALKGEVGKGIDRRKVWERYRDLKARVLGSNVASITWHGVVIEVSLSVSQDLLRELDLGKINDRKDDEQSGFVERQVNFGADSYTIRIREDNAMTDAKVVCLLPANLNNGKALRWIHPLDGGSSRPKAGNIPTVSKPIVSTTATKELPDGWGKPGRGVVDLQLLLAEYRHIKVNDYKGKVPAGSVIVFVYWGIAFRLYQELPFKNDPEKDHLFAEASLDGDSIKIYLKKEKIEDGRKIGFRVRNLAGKDPNTAEWRWPGVRLDHMARRAGDSITGVKWWAASLLKNNG